MTFTLGELRHAEPQERAGEIMRGPYWAITRDGDDYILCYLSSDLAGTEKRITMQEEQVRAIIAGSSSVVPFLPPPS